MLPRDKITRYTSDINMMRVKRTFKKKRSTILLFLDVLSIHIVTKKYA